MVSSQKYHSNLSKNRMKQLDEQLFFCHQLDVDLEEYQKPRIHDRPDQGQKKKKKIK
jgi:hypothetical protein